MREQRTGALRWWRPSGRLGDWETGMCGDAPQTTTQHHQQFNRTDTKRVCSLMAS